MLCKSQSSSGEKQLSQGLKHSFVYSVIIQDKTYTKLSKNPAGKCAGIKYFKFSLSIQYLFILEVILKSLCRKWAFYYLKSKSDDWVEKQTDVYKWV